MIRMIRRTTYVIAAVVVLATASGGWWMTRATTASGFSIRMSPLVRTLQFSARVATTSRVDIGSTVTGRVTQVAVVEGAQVKKGSALVRLESDELNAAMAQAQANVQQASAKLAGLRSTGRSVANAAVMQANSVLIAAQSELIRTQALVKQGFLSEAKLDEVQRALSVAQAQLNSAQAQQTANTEQGTDVIQAQAQFTLAKSAAEAAKARLAQAVVTAPADAKVLSRLVEPGQIVQPGRALLSLALTSPLQLVAQVDERFLEQLQVGQFGDAVADAYPNQRFAVKVQSISPLVDAQRGAIEVKFTLVQAPPVFLREDMTLSIEVETARRDKALVVPIAAIRTSASNAATSATVLIEKNGRVEERLVRLGLRTLEAVEVLEGLAVGDIVLLGATPKVGHRIHAQVMPVNFVTSNKNTRDDAGSVMTNAMGR